MALASLPFWLGLAWLLPLASFTVIVLSYSAAQFAGRKISAAASHMASLVATGAIIGSCILSFIALLFIWLPNQPAGSANAAHAAAHGTEAGEHAPAEHAPAEHAPAEHSLLQPGGGRIISTVAFAHAAPEPGVEEAHGGHAAGGGTGEHHDFKPAVVSGDWYEIASFGSLRITIGYYIDALTVSMFCMVTLIASCIHIYASGYMHDELHDITDHEVTLSDGHHLHRPGRYHRFFQSLSLFCFSMLGIVIAGNIAMVFVFWELVGICSYFLIGFYIERKSASNAANKAFIVNRVGDFGMIIGLMALFGSLGTFAFGDSTRPDGTVRQGIFSLVRPAESHHALIVPDGMVQASMGAEAASIAADHGAEFSPADAAKATESELESRIPERRQQGYGYWLLVVAGLGIFCGCVGKSAQFPLQTWLPDAMEGPTPVSALVHSATMVAAGVYLVGRFYPVFAPETLLVIAYIGGFTLLLAASIALTATDIKRVLAYSTVSQLGYMMLALGIGGWVAGLFHLLTHAFFKSLLFLCSGSVIHAVHTNDMNEMGGLLKKMPITGYTMLIGCLAIIGAGIPFAIFGVMIGFSGFYSKDSIIEQALLFSKLNPAHSVLMFATVGGAFMTAFYMFRMWFMTFLGQPRNHHKHDHAHESPRVMTGPLVVLAFFAVTVGWSLPSWAPGILSNLGAANLLEDARPLGTLAGGHGYLLPNLTIPNEHDSHVAAIKEPATWMAFSTAMAGLLLAAAVYAWNKLNAAEMKRHFKPLHSILWNKWYFDEVYGALFIQPTHFVARRVAQFDRRVLDGIIHALASGTKWLSRQWDFWLDQIAVDGLINTIASKTWNVGLSLRSLQTGRLRQYVMFIVVGTVALFALVSFVWSVTAAG